MLCMGMSSHLVVSMGSGGALIDTRLLLSVHARILPCFSLPSGIAALDDVPVTDVE